VLSDRSYGSGRPVVVLPGLGLDAQFMSAVTEPAMSDCTDYLRIYLSLPGAGSEVTCAPSSDDILDVVTAWVESELGDETFALLGHSYGGYLASALASRFKARVERMLVVCSGVKIDPTRRDVSGVLPPDTEAGWLDACPADLHDHLSYAVGRQHRDVGDRLAAAFTDGHPSTTSSSPSCNGVTGCPTNHLSRTCPGAITC